MIPRNHRTDCVVCGEPIVNRNKYAKYCKECYVKLRDDNLMPKTRLLKQLKEMNNDISVIKQDIENMAALMGIDDLLHPPEDVFEGDAS